jgi:hypothetical protein
MVYQDKNPANATEGRANNEQKLSGWTDYRKRLQILHSSHTLIRSQEGVAHEPAWTASREGGGGVIRSTAGCWCRWITAVPVHITPNKRPSDSPVVCHLLQVLLCDCFTNHSRKWWHTLFPALVGSPNWRPLFSSGVRWMTVWKGPRFTPPTPVATQHGCYRNQDNKMWRSRNSLANQGH